MDSARLPFARSIRFRLTAWYAALIFAIILAVGFGLSKLIERELRRDVDQRLITTARDMTGQFTSVGPFVYPPIPDLFTFPGQLIEVVNDDNNVVQRSGNLGDRNLPAPPVTTNDRHHSYQTVVLDGVSIRVLHYPLVVKDTGQVIGAVNVGEPLLQINQTLAHVRQLLLLGSLAGVALAALGGWFLAGRALRPVDRITATAAAIASGSTASLATRLQVPDTGDELARLAATFNQMLDRLEETFTQQRRFIADASHELRTPLTAIRGNIDVMLRQSDAAATGGGDLAEALEDLRRETARMSRLIEDLLTLARTDAPPDDAQRRRLVRLDVIVQDVARTATSLARGQRLDVVAPQPVAIIADRDRITELILILLDNAIRHTAAGGQIQIALVSGGGLATLSVRDTGEGIAPEHLPHVFERFYRADAARDRSTGGTGLGLAIARAIARSHGGDIAVASRLGVGTAFTVTLPLAPLQLMQQALPSATA
jgi:two-component system, OmpR family, sensor kinase